VKRTTTRKERKQRKRARRRAVKAKLLKRKNSGEERHSPSIHHILPWARGGRDGNNLVTLPRSIHEAWHHIFDLLTPLEAVVFIGIVFLSGQTFTMKDLAALRTFIMERGADRREQESS